jgi:hypothetical protein
MNTGLIALWLCISRTRQVYPARRRPTVRAQASSFGSARTFLHLCDHELMMDLADARARPERHCLVSGASFVSILTPQALESEWPRHADRCILRRPMMPTPAPELDHDKSRAIKHQGLLIG